MLNGEIRRFLRLQTVRSRVPVSRSQLYRLMAAGDFPRAYNLGARAVGWLEAEVDAWIQALFAPEQK
jgi:prophage regulatory protein